MKIQGTENTAFILEELGKRIHDVRVNMNISQQELAKLSGVSLRTIGRLESGEGIALGNLINILRILGMLPNIDLLVTSQSFIPTDYVDYGKQRQRISRKNNSNNNSEWKWGEDK